MKYAINFSVYIFLPSFSFLFQSIASTLNAKYIYQKLSSFKIAAQYGNTNNHLSIPLQNPTILEV